MSSSDWQQRPEQRPVILNNERELQLLSEQLQQFGPPESVEIEELCRWALLAGQDSEPFRALQRWQDHNQAAEVFLWPENGQFLVFSHQEIELLALAPEH